MDCQRLNPLGLGSCSDCIVAARAGEGCQNCTGNSSSPMEPLKLEQTFEANLDPSTNAENRFAEAEFRSESSRDD